MAVAKIIPTRDESSSLMEASTLTGGDAWGVAGLSKVNETMQIDPAVVPPDAAVSTSVPED